MSRDAAMEQSMTMADLRLGIKDLAEKMDRFLQVQAQQQREIDALRALQAAGPPHPTIASLDPADRAALDMVLPVLMHERRSTTARTVTSREVIACCSTHSARRAALVEVVGDLDAAATANRVGKLLRRAEGAVFGGVVQLQPMGGRSGAGKKWRLVRVEC